MKIPRLGRHRLGLAALMVVVIAVAIGISSAVGLADGGPTGPASGVRPAAIVYRPSGLSTAKPVPLLVALYGADGCPQCMEGLTHFEAVADQYGFVVVYPGSALVGGTPWTSSGDVSYIGALISPVESSQNLDPTRVYVAGFSAGGRFAYQLGCALSKQITAIAIVGSVQRPYACSLSHPVSELTIAGSQEAVNGIAATGIPSAYTVEGWWRVRDGCTGPVDSAVVAPLAEQMSESCVDGASVGLLIVEGGHHTWPGCSCGLSASDPDSQWGASQGIWSFFAAHQTGSLTTPVAKLLSTRFVAGGSGDRSVSTTFDLGEQVTVTQTLSDAYGADFGSATSTLNPGAQVSLVLPLAPDAPAGAYSLALNITDSYGRTLTLVSGIQIGVEPSGGPGPGPAKPKQAGKPKHPDRKSTR